MSSDEPTPKVEDTESPGATASGATAVDSSDDAAKKKSRRWWALVGLGLLVGALVTAGVAALLMSILQRKQEASQPYFQVVELTDTTVDPAVWGRNFPIQYEAYKSTANDEPDKMVKRTPTADDPRTWKAPSKLEADPRLVTMWQGYAFSVEYNEPRGHEWMLIDQRLVKRVTQFKQPGTCLNCHASTYVLMNQLGNGDIFKGFDAMNHMTYKEATSKVDHPVGCIDCHDPKTMQLRISRPAFMTGIKEYKASQGIENFDVNKDATANEMRAYVCAQCHVEYYFKGAGKTLTFPWEKGLTVYDAYNYYNEVGWSDFQHKLTGAFIIKAQHPDFETYSNGVHASAGVTCADCHMPYKRVGAMKVSDHWVRSPMATTEQINASCLTCHHFTEAEMKKRVDTIHTRYETAHNTSFDALDALIKDLQKAKDAGTATPEQIKVAQAYQRKAQFFMDYVVSENSRGFHAPAYTIQILNDVTDASHKGQLALKGEYDAKDVPAYPTAMPTAAPSSPAPSGSSTASAPASASASATSSPS